MDTQKENINVHKTQDEENPSEIESIDSKMSSGEKDDQKKEETPAKLIGGHTQREMKYIVTAGVLLSLNCGFVNGCCLSGLVLTDGTIQSVAGFTGAYTNSALGLAGGQIDIFGRQVCMILSFIAGACISGMMTPRATPYQIEPTYGPTFLIGGVFLMVASALAYYESDSFFYFVAAANGIQNGISSIYSANLIRSTHLTGTSTDIGLFVGQMLRGNKDNIWKLGVLVALASSFWLGGLISFYGVRQFAHYTILFNAGLFILIGVGLVYYLVSELQISIKNALFGTWTWEAVFNQLDKHGDGWKHDDFFTGIDEDNDGSLDKDELHQALTKLGIKVSKTQCNQLVQMADKDGDGKIDAAEWQKIVKSMAPSA